MLTVDQVAAALASFWGIKSDKLNELSGGADHDAATFKAESDQGDYFIKVRLRQQNQNTSILLEFLAEAGIGNIIFAD